MSEMKPCPFCGKEDLYFEQDEEGETNIVCDWCEYKTRIFQTIGDAARWWNTRPIEDALNKRIAELEEAQRWIPVSERMPEVYDETKWKENLIRVRELFADRFGDVDVEQFFQKIRSESYPGSTKGE